MKKLIVFSEMVNEMIVNPLSEALRIAVAKGAKITGSSRCCIMLPMKRNRLILHAGYPEEDHSIGQEITGEHADFLKSIMHKHQRILHVRDPARDPRTPHLKEHATYHGISSILFAPLLSKEEPLGIMVFDFTSIEVESAETIKTAKIVGDFVARAIAHARGNAREKEDVTQKKRVTIIGRRYSHATSTLFRLLITGKE